MIGSFLFHHISGKVVLAVSGGVDSMVMLDMAIKNLPKTDIIVAHFNHMLRGADADKDEAHVRSYCKAHSLAFVSESRDIANISQKEGLGTEEAARIYRYDFLYRICQKYHATLCTAHHQNDRIETALFHLIRGTKLTGIHALKAHADVHTPYGIVRLVRPMISVSKDEIEHYASAQGIVFCEDTTNSDTTITRNYIRQHIVPHFAHINPNYQKAIEDFIAYTEACESWHTEWVERWLHGQNQVHKRAQEKYQSLWPNIAHAFSKDAFIACAPFEKRLIIAYLYRISAHGSTGLSEAIIAEIERFIVHGNNSYGSKHIHTFCLEKR